MIRDVNGSIARRGVLLVPVPARLTIAIPLPACGERFSHPRPHSGIRGPDGENSLPIPRLENAL